MFGNKKLREEIVLLRSRIIELEEKEKLNKEATSIYINAFRERGKMIRHINDRYLNGLSVKNLFDDIMFNPAKNVIIFVSSGLEMSELSYALSQKFKNNKSVKKMSKKGFNIEFMDGSTVRCVLATDNARGYRSDYAYISRQIDMDNVNNICIPCSVHGGYTYFKN
jgi:alkaline phosphatase